MADNEVLSAGGGDNSLATTTNWNHEMGTKKLDAHIKVAVRCRPPLEFELK